MRRYKTVKTTMGHKYLVRQTEDEVLERRIYWAAVAVLPFLSAALMMTIWLKGA